MTEITIPANDARCRYIATSGQTVFDYDYPVYDSSHIRVWQNETELTETTHYTVQDVGEQAGGTITLVGGATEDDIIVVERDVPAARTSDYQTRGAFLASTINLDLDRNIMMIQQLARDLGRCLVLNKTDGSLLVELPAAADRAGLYLKFDASGNVTVADGTTGVTVSDFMETVLDDTTAAAARTTLEAASAATVTTNTNNISANAVDIVVNTNAITALDIAAAKRANNLSDLTNAATARSNLGLDTAATKVAGTGADEVLLLAEAAKLPVLDGSQLTELTVAQTGGVELITANTTIYVNYIGGFDFTSIEAALNSLKDKRIAADVTVTISLIAGSNPLAASETWYHPDADRIFITGSTSVAVKSITSVQGITDNGAWDHEVEYNVDAVTGVTTGMIALIPGNDTVAGTGGYDHHPGAWEILSIDAGNSRITVKNTHNHTAFAATGLTAADLVILDSVLTAGNNNYYITLNSVFGGIDNIAFVRDTNGYILANGSYVGLGGCIKAYRCGFMSGVSSSYGPVKITSQTGPWTFWECGFSRGRYGFYVATYMPVQIYFHYCGFNGNSYNIGIGANGVTLTNCYICGAEYDGVLSQRGNSIFFVAWSRLRNNFGYNINAGAGTFAMLRNSHIDDGGSGTDIYADASIICGYGNTGTIVTSGVNNAEFKGI